MMKEQTSKQRKKILNINLTFKLCPFSFLRQNLNSIIQQLLLPAVVPFNHTVAHRQRRRHRRRWTMNDIMTRRQRCMLLQQLLLLQLLLLMLLLQQLLMQIQWHCICVVLRMGVHRPSVKRLLLVGRWWLGGHNLCLNHFLETGHIRVFFVNFHVCLVQHDRIVAQLAHGAPVRLSIDVTLTMLRRGRRELKCHRAQTAFERTITGVYDNVISETVSPCESFVTVIAREFTFLRMGQLVLFQCGRGAERAATDVALEIFNARVTLQMFYQNVFGIEGHRTQRAFVSAAKD